MSSSRHSAPLIEYSLSPVRNSVRVMATSFRSTGSRRAVLSIVKVTSARPSAARLSVPTKMTSSIFAERTVLGPWAPSTQAIASTMFDFPEPFGPTTTVTPGSNSSVVGSAKDLKPLRESDFRNTSWPRYRNDARILGIPGPAFRPLSRLSAGSPERNTTSARPL